MALIYLSICQDRLAQLGDSKGFYSIFESSCHLLLPVYHSKVQAIPLSC